MSMYEIVLVCWYCRKEHALGFVQAASEYEALREAERRWPDARFEEMFAYKFVENRLRNENMVSFSQPQVL